MNSVLGKVMGTIGNLFGSGDKKKKEKEKEIQEKVRQTEDIGRKIEALVTSSRDSYRDDFNKLEEMTSGSFSKPKEIRKLVQKKAEGYNKNLGEIANRRPDITDEKNASNASPNDPESNCNEMHDCNLNTPEQRKLKGVKDYIAGAREYVKGAYSGDDAKEREGILDSADSLTDAASAHYRNGDIELGDETVELAKKVADIVVGATPVVGDIVDIASAITGKNLITDEPLSDEEAIIQVASALTSLATGGYVGTINDIRKGGNVLKEAIKQHVKKEAKKEAKKQAGDIARKEGERRMKQAEEGERQAKDANKKETAEDFYRSNRDKPPGERVAAIRTKADALAKEKGMQKDNKISKMNNRTVYKDNDGSYWSVDTLHGTFEKLDSKGRHQGEYDFDFKIIDGTQDRSGGHDLRIQ
ncbi:MAG: hypothetical protein H7318_15720 [Oligoflexus sp.]|nr:hypothetical protein [Oligoflexus sp.]